MISEDFGLRRGSAPRWGRDMLAILYHCRCRPDGAERGDSSITATGTIDGDVFIMLQKLMSLNNPFCTETVLRLPAIQIFDTIAGLPSLLSELQAWVPFPVIFIANIGSIIA